MGRFFLKNECSPSPAKKKDGMGCLVLALDQDKGPG